VSHQNAQTVVLSLVISTTTPQVKFTQAYKTVTSNKTKPQSCSLQRNIVKTMLVLHMYYKLFNETDPGLHNEVITIKLSLDMTI